MMDQLPAFQMYGRDLFIDSNNYSYVKIQEIWWHLITDKNEHLDSTNKVHKLVFISKQSFNIDTMFSH